VPHAPHASIDQAPRTTPQPSASPDSPLLQIERTWLGLTAPPLPVRMAEAAWGPDHWTSYCQRCGQTVGPHAADDTGCPTCRAHKLPWERLIRLGEFDGLLREMVHDVKFDRWRRLGDDLGRLLGQSVGEALDRAAIPRSLVTVVPVPSSLRRRLTRGVDHALVIARGLAAHLNAPIAQPLRRLHRPAQATLPRSDRLSNVSRAFRPRYLLGSPLHGRTILLVDDVTTTRATLRAAALTLNECLKRPAANAPPQSTRIWACVLAVTPENPGKSAAKRAKSADPVRTA
jgi:predicted amidophosphoribosyltransferase